MRDFVLFILFLVGVLVLPTKCEDGIEANKCTADVCKTSDGCRCSTFTSPLESDEQGPQLISLTFDQHVTDNLFNILQPVLFNRVNPDGHPIGATFFVAHEYTDYTRVNDLYNYGFEIGVHSVTESALQFYWRNADATVLEKEFGGQKRILNKFGNIPEKDIIGVRTPQLELAGNYSIKAYQAAGLSYDSSWPTSPDKPLYPYTLDYMSTQQCFFGIKCPNEVFKNFWILPINDLRGIDGRECNTIASCNISGTADNIADWLTGEIDKIRNGTRVPLTLLISSVWFEFTENSFEGLIKFLDNLATYDDVFLVSQKQVLEWTKSPVPLSQFKTEFSERNATCTPYSCKLKKPDGEDRYLQSCIPCPASFPWIDNPDGD